MNHNELSENKVCPAPGQELLEHCKAPEDELDSPAAIRRFLTSIAQLTEAGDVSPSACAAIVGACRAITDVLRLERRQDIRLPDALIELIARTEPGALMHLVPLLSPEQLDRILNPGSEVPS